MTLRRKTLLIISVTLLSLNAGLYAIASTILMHGYAQVEEQAIRQSLDRALSVFDNERDDLNTANIYTSAWDDTYNFIQNPTQAYIENNCSDAALKKLGLNLIAFVDASGQIVRSFASDSQAKTEVNPPSNLPTIFAANPKILQHLDTRSSHTGILLLPEGALMFASRPILRSQGQGPIRGSYITGFYLNSRKIQEISTTARLPIALQLLDNTNTNTQIPEDFQAAHRSLSTASEKTFFVQALDQDTVAGYTQLTDASGKPALLLRISNPRVIYKQGQQTIHYFLITFLIVEFVFGGVTLLILEKLVLSRLLRLSDTVGEIGANGDLSIGLSLPGKDELSRLADAINSTFVQLNQSQRALQESEKAGFRAKLIEATNLELTKEIEQRKQIEQSLFQEKELAQVTLHSIGDAVITTDVRGCIQSLNPVAEKLTGWSCQEARSQELSQVFQVVDEARDALENPIEQVLQRNQIAKAAPAPLLLARDGNCFAIEYSTASIHSSNGQIMGSVLVFRDVTESRRLANRLFWKANHDSLTKLFNRHAFEQYVEQLILNPKRRNQHHALCLLDLDQFKIVNDTCGHAAGDELLRQISTLLQDNVRGSDVLARLGGDEFGLLIYRCSVEQALNIAQALREVIQKFRFIWQDKSFSLGVSIGVVIIDAESENLSNLLSAADAACYAAKNKGRNRVHLYQLDDRDLLIQRGEMLWVACIPKALEENRFRLFCQPIVPVSGEQAYRMNGRNHYEILLRLENETGEIVAPMAFIPAAERYNLMHLIDRWVIRTLFAQLASQDFSSLNSLLCNAECQFSINLSGDSLNDEHFVEFVQEQFALHQIPPQIICFEVTETLAIANLNQAAQFIHRLKALGCRFSLDDFGSGMSSFGYLKNLPIDYLKIDGVFIRDIVDNPVTCEIVEAINRIGHCMGIQTIAEFVENNNILMKIKELGINYAQGYEIAEPIPFEMLQQIK